MTKQVYHPLDIGVEEFLTTIFPPEDIPDSQCVLLAHPESFIDAQGKRVDYYKQMAATPAHIRRAQSEANGWLYCVSTVQAVPRGEKIRRRLEDIRTAWVIVLDDIGTKAVIPPVAPSFIVETSAGNFQYGYRIEPLDVSDPMNAAYFDACLVGLAHAGFNDKGCRTAARVMKLPGARHKSGNFDAQVVEWEPDRSWELEALMNEMGVTPGAVQPKPVRAVSSTKSRGLDELDDPILELLAQRGLITGQGSDQWRHLHCPWEDEHTSGDPENPGSSTSYSPLDYGEPGRQFKCLHGHCEHRGWQDLKAWAVDQGVVLVQERPSYQDDAIKHSDKLITGKQTT